MQENRVVMAKRTIRKTDPEHTTAPARRRKAAPAEVEAAAEPKAPRTRRKIAQPVEAVTVVDVAQETTTTVGTTAVEITPEQIAVRAYYISLERGGRPGDQFADWILAERQLREQLAAAR